MLDFLLATCVTITILVALLGRDVMMFFVAVILSVLWVVCEKTFNRS